MFQFLSNVLGHREAGRPRRVWLQVERLEERQVLSHSLGESVLLEHVVTAAVELEPHIAVPQAPPLDMTSVAQQFPTHAGPTTLYLNFSGWEDYDEGTWIEAIFTEPHSVSSFQGTTGNVDRDIQEILFRASEIFAPFNVRVARRFGEGSRSTSNGNTTVFIGNNNAVNGAHGFTFWGNVDSPGIDIHYDAGDIDIDYGSLGGVSLDFEPPSFTVTDHAPNSNPYDYAFVDPYGSTTWSNTRIAQVVAHEAGEQVWLQNSYTYLQAVLGNRPSDDRANLAHPWSADAAYLDPTLQTVTPGMTVTGHIGVTGDYDVFRLPAPGSANATISITVTPIGGLDPVLMIYDETAGGMLDFYSNDRSASDVSSKVNFLREPGHTYRLVVGAADGATTGPYTLSVATVNLRGSLPIATVPTSLGASAPRTSTSSLGLGSPELEDDAVQRSVVPRRSVRNAPTAEIDRFFASVPSQASPPARAVNGERSALDRFFATFGERESILASGGPCRSWA